MKKRAVIYVDGFNLYYGAIRGGTDKWLDLAKYFGTIRRDDDVLRIFYFTAVVSGDAAKNQAVYLRALSTTPSVSIILGRFKEKSVDCGVAGCCHPGPRKYAISAEKRTDVNIALQMLQDAYEDFADLFIVVSGDSDLVPAVDRVRTRFPHKRVIVYVPARDPHRSAAVELRAAAHASRNLPLNLLARSQFPPTIQDGSGQVISKPFGW